MKRNDEKCVMVIPMPLRLKKKIEEASKHGMTSSSAWVRQACLERLNGNTVSKIDELTSVAKVVEEVVGFDTWMGKKILNGLSDSEKEFIKRLLRRLKEKEE